MKRAFRTISILAVGIFICQPVFSRGREALRNSNADAYSRQTGDSLVLLSTRSDDNSLFNGVIPSSPQAAALARYAEYPVSHTTGIPDITIPLYEIRMGNFTLPISISYHASGARPNEIHTCVGQGWSLNAGGAITRTIMSAPDLYYYDAATTDYKYFEVRNVNDLIKQFRENAGPDDLQELLNPDSYRDSESDRYCFNAGGHTGVFRYSFEEGKYVMLDRSSYIVTSKYCYEDSYFILYCPDNTEYEFRVHEKTGPGPDGDEPRYTTSWYVSRITTPYGEVRINYLEPDDYFFYVGGGGSTCWFGEYPDIQWVIPGVAYNKTWKYGVRGTEYPFVNMCFKQKLVSSIEWEGNRIDFTYTKGGDREYNLRLAEMKVWSSDNELVKEVKFGNDRPWQKNKSRPRRMLRSLEDSQSGTYSFIYNENGVLPDGVGTDIGKITDLWGYYNGSGTSSYSKSLFEWIFRKDDEMLLHYGGGCRDRSPKLELTSLGILTGITFPTGGRVKYEYELNELNGKKYGGLRIAATTLSDGEMEKLTTYKYSTGVLPQMHPDSLSTYACYLRLYFGNSKIPETRRYIAATTNPITSCYTCQSPVLYTCVTEQRSDGTSTEYVYDPVGISAPQDRGDCHHPSVYDEALVDRGASLPILKNKTEYSSSGQMLSCETYDYHVSETKYFKTGVRLASVTNGYVYDDEDGGFDTGNGANPFSVSAEELQVRQTYARQLATILVSSETEDYTTGFKKRTDYTYDSPQYRTTLPLSESVTGSDGSVVTTLHEYPFHRSGELYDDMIELGYSDWQLSSTRMSGDKIIGKNETEYKMIENRLYTFANSSWSMPTKDCYASDAAVPAILPERERVSEYNVKCRPLSIKVNETDDTLFEWNDSCNMLLKSTAPGGLTTTYTHRPLFGLASVAQPNGLKTRYEYNSMGNLSRVFVNLACTDTYDYSIANHPDGNYNSKGNSVISRHYLTQDGLVRTVDQQFYDGLGRPSVLAKAGANTSGKYLYSAVTYDNHGRELRNVMPAIGGNSIEEKKASEVLTMTASTYGDSYAYSENSYDALDRPVKVTTPGQAWHDAGEKGKVTEYVGNAASSVRLYSAPMGTISLVENGYYAASTLQGVRTIDEDGNEMTVYTDRLGRKVLERRGPESAKGKNDTYFVYNDLGQLRYVLSPGYELSGYKDKFAYEYRYDEHGNVVKKFIPGGGYTQYWYDRAGRMTFMHDENLRAQNLHRFFIYDRAGRQALQGTTAVCNRSSSVNFADYTGGTSGFQSTGYTLQDASRIQQVTLETVNYYDDYRFASALDSRLVQTTSVSAKGLGTGSVTYNSEGGKSMSALYYDIRGNVTTLREITDFGTLRVTDNTYTFTNQPLTTKMTESGGVTMLTENTYDTNSGLLVATDVTVNGVKQRVSKVTYDDLGRIASVVRGNGSNSAGTVSYSYNMHGQTTAINGPGFTQKLHYTNGPGKPLYNGSISSMLWTMGSDATQRGYRYTYNGYNWLTLAEYGEGSTLSTHKDRYTERFSEFMLNGGIRRLQRHGLKADGNYGKIDNLHISYNGNRITTVLEDADPVTQSGSMDYPGEKREMSFGYNDWGALVSDESRGIESIEYDSFGNPVHIKFSGRDYTKNVYSATGVKLATEHYTHPLQTGPVVMGDEPQAYTEAASSQIGPGIIGPEHHLLAGQQKIEYRGPVIYRNFKIDMVLFPGGYATIGNDDAVTFHYYTQDYLGNNRAVVNGSTGAVEQTTAYYPYGAVIPDLGTGNSGQPFKFGGKELVNANGLNAFDFGARLHYPAIPQFDRIDPMCETFTWLSPYLYCANNPVNLIDMNGEAPTEIEAAIMADYVYQNEKDKVKLIGNWKPSERKFSDPIKWKDGSGFKSMLFERTVDGVTEYAYAFAGTDGFDLKDWKNNIQQIFGCSEQYSLAMDNAAYLKENIEEELTFVGHSLGGGLAAASAYATGGHAMTFNAAGVSTMTVDTSAPANIEAFVIDRDELNAFQKDNKLPTANGNIQWRTGKAALMGHDIKNFYQPSMSSRIYNSVKSSTMNFINNINNYLKPQSHFPF